MGCCEGLTVPRLQRSDTVYRVLVGSRRDGMTGGHGEVKVRDWDPVHC